MWKWKPYVEFQYGGRFGEFNGMSSHSHVSHRRVLPLGEFTVTIPQPHATLQGAVTWRNQCCDPATIAGCKNSIRHIENRFSPYFIYFLFLMQFRLWRAAAFVSSPIHLFYMSHWCEWHMWIKGYLLTYLTNYSRLNFTFLVFTLYSLDCLLDTGTGQALSRSSVYYGLPYTIWQAIM